MPENTEIVEVSRDGRWLQVSASEGTEPRNDLWIADLEAAPPESPAFQLGFEPIPFEKIGIRPE